MSKPIYFSGGVGSNFHRARIVLWSPIQEREVSFPGNEWYFHCYKTFVIKHKDARKWHERIRTARTATIAKELGRKVPGLDIEEWDNLHAPVAMLTCNLAKYQQNPHCLAWLKETGNRPLVEHRADKRWGDNLNGTGRNQLGKTLELVRVILT